MRRDAQEKRPGRSNTEGIAEAKHFPKGTQEVGGKLGLSVAWYSRSLSRGRMAGPLHLATRAQGLTSC